MIDDCCIYRVKIDKCPMPTYRSFRLENFVNKITSCASGWAKTLIYVLLFSRQDGDIGCTSTVSSNNEQEDTAHIAHSFGCGQCPSPYHRGESDSCSLLADLPLFLVAIGLTYSNAIIIWVLHVVNLRLINCTGLWTSSQAKSCYWSPSSATAIRPRMLMMCACICSSKKEAVPNHSTLFLKSVEFH